MVDPGTWRIERKPGVIRFTHELASMDGYGYLYAKTITFTPGKPEMILAQELKNTGSKPIDTTVFNHGFFQIDAEPAGPGLTWTFPFAPHTPGDFSNMAEIRDHEIVYLRELKPPHRQAEFLEPPHGLLSRSFDPSAHGAGRNRKMADKLRVLRCTGKGKSEMIVPKGLD